MDMELENFISETLKQVARGIKQAQEQTKEHKMTIVPHCIAFSQGSHVFNDRTGEPIDYLEFNIVVTPQKGGSENNDKESVVVATTTPDGSFRDFSPYMSRIKFSVPMHLPKDSAK
jgi:hypothetical protein